MRPLQVDAFTRLAKALCCKGGVLCITAQRLGLEDPTGQLIAKEKITDPEVPLTLLWSVVACLFLLSAEDPRLKTWPSTRKLEGVTAHLRRFRNPLQPLVPA